MTVINFVWLFHWKCAFRLVVLVGEKRTSARTTHDSEKDFLLVENINCYVASSPLPFCFSDCLHSLLPQQVDGSCKFNQLVALFFTPGGSGRRERLGKCTTRTGKMSKWRCKENVRQGTSWYHLCKHLSRDNFTSRASTELTQRRFEGCSSFANWCNNFLSGFTL